MGRLKCDQIKQLITLTSNFIKRLLLLLPKTLLAKFITQNFKPELLDFPFMENYSSYGDHGKKYSEKEGREQNVDYYPDIKLV